MRVSRTIVAAVSGAAVSGVATAAVLLPLSGAFADTTGTSDDRGECVTYRKTIPRAEAEDLLREEGLVPADGALDGYEIGYVPDYVGDAAYDLDEELWFGDEFDVEEDEEESSDTMVTRYWIGDEVDVFTDTSWGEEEQWVDWGGPLYVDVARSEQYTDIDALLEEYGGYDDYFEGEEVHELPDGVGYYTGYEALMVPEPGVAITLWLEPEDENDEFPDGGSVDEVRAIVDGIEPADS